MGSSGMWNARTLGRLLIVSALVTLGMASAGTAAAQPIPDVGGKVFGFVGGSFGDGGTAVVTSGGAGLRITQRLGIDLELSHLSGLDLSDDNRFVIQQLTFAPPFWIEREGSVTAFLAKLNVDFTVADRLIPFVSAAMSGGCAFS